MNYTVDYEHLDKHWIVAFTSNPPSPDTVMRFPTKQQAISYIDNRLKIHIQKEIRQITKNEDNSEKKD